MGTVHSRRSQLTGLFLVRRLGGGFLDGLAAAATRYVTRTAKKFIINSPEATGIRR